MDWREECNQKFASERCSRLADVMHRRITTMRCICRKYQECEHHNICWMQIRSRNKIVRKRNILTCVQPLDAASANKKNIYNFVTVWWWRRPMRIIICLRGGGTMMFDVSSLSHQSRSQTHHAAICQITDQHACWNFITCFCICHI